MGTNSTHDPSAIEVLSDDHEHLRELARRASSASSAERRERLAQLGAALRIHSRLEEDVLYPAFLEAADTDDDRRLFAESLAEHERLERALLALERAHADGFSAALRALEGELADHVRKETEQTFARLAALVDVGKLRELGARLVEFRAELARAIATETRG